MFYEVIYEETMIIEADSFSEAEELAEDEDFIQSEKHQSEKHITKMYMLDDDGSVLMERSYDVE